MVFNNQRKYIFIIFFFYITGYKEILRTFLITIMIQIFLILVEFIQNLGTYSYSH
jgi:hypothetical protein